jgi:hypothetical protein
VLVTFVIVWFLLFDIWNFRRKVADGGTLSRSYGRCFAEFLNHVSLVRLGLLDLPTCVGLRYGLIPPRAIELFEVLLQLYLTAAEALVSPLRDV